MDVVSSSACLGMEELDQPKLRKMKIILKLKKKIDEVVVPGPAAVASSSSSSEKNNSMKLKLEATKRKLEQSYADEAEKKAKKKIQLIDDFPKTKNNLEMKALVSDFDGDVRERLLAKMKRLKKKNQNLKPKYTLYSKKACI